MREIVNDSVSERQRIPIEVDAFDWISEFNKRAASSPGSADHDPLADDRLEPLA